MPTPNDPFKGFCAIRVSSKRNVTLPSGWKSGLSGPLFICRGQEHGLPFIQVIPPALLHGRPNEIEGPNWTAREKKIHAEELVSENYRPIRLGTRSRLTLPRKWCAEADISFPGEVVIAGRGASFEFWRPENFALLIQRELSETDEESTFPGPLASNTSGLTTIPYQDS